MRRRHTKIYLFDKTLRFCYLQVISQVLWCTRTHNWHYEQNELVSHDTWASLSYECMKDQAPEYLTSQFITREQVIFFSKRTTQSSRKLNRTASEQ